MKAIVLKSHAKLNLYLRVINKRPDGYHNLKTIFERINLYDDVAFSANRTGRIKILCDHPQVPTGPGNLVYKAAAVLRERYQVSQGVAIRIIKRIPVAAGLAGGSSNAATALVGLNKVWSLGLTKKEMLDIGNSLGSDIAFFLHDCSWALGEGRGERITRLNIKSRFWHVLVVPKVKMYTVKVYRGLKLKLTNNKDNANILTRYLQKKNINKIYKYLGNDLEHSIVTIVPSLKNVPRRLKALGAEGVSFSGSGPTVFCLLWSRQDAECLKRILQKRYSQVFVVSTW